MAGKNLRTGWRAWLFGEGGYCVPYERVVPGHLMLEHEGALLDLGPCTVEDLRLIAFVSQEAYVRLPSKRGRSKSTPGTLSRVRRITNQFWQASLDPENRRVRRILGGRLCDGSCSVAVGENGVATSGEQVSVSGSHETDQALDPETVERRSGLI